MSSVLMTLLPVELQMNILERLPIKALIRFRSVSKSFNSIIDSLFVSQRLKHSNTSPKKILAICKDDQRQDAYGKYKVTIYSSTTLDDISKLEIPLPEDHNTSHVYSNNHNPDFKVVGSCNGLICLSNELNYQLYLWNPSINNFMTLPYTSKVVRSNWCAHGFGYHRENNDYKVVRLTYNDFYMDDQVPRVQVYSHNKGSWNRLPGQGINIIYYNLIQLPNVFFNASIHWLARRLWSAPTRLAKKRHAIVLFNILKNTLKKMEIPDELFAVGKSEISLGLFKDSIGLFVSLPHDDTEFGHIWIMQEYGVATSWTRLFTIGREDVVSRLSPYVYCDDLRLVEDERGFCLCTTTRFMFIGEENKIDRLQVVSYVESSVWPRDQVDASNA